MGCGQLVAGTWEENRGHREPAPREPSLRTTRPPAQRAPPPPGRQPHEPAVVAPPPLPAGGGAEPGGDPRALRPGIPCLRPSPAAAAVAAAARRAGGGARAQEPAQQVPRYLHRAGGEGAGRDAGGGGRPRSRAGERGRRGRLASSSRLPGGAGVG